MGRGGTEWDGWDGEGGEKQNMRRMLEDTFGVEDGVILITVSVLIAITVVFDLVEEYLQEHTEQDFKCIIQALYGELTTLGFVGLLLFMIQHVDVDRAIGEAFDFDKKELDELFENIHMVLFMVMCIFLASNVFLAKRAKSVVRTAAEWEQSSFNDADVVRKLGVHMFHEAIGGPLVKYMRWGMKFFTGHLEEYLQRACYACIRLDFIAADLIDSRFDFSLYISIVLGTRVAELVEIPSTTWLAVWITFTAFWLLQGHASNDSRIMNLIIFGLTILVMLDQLHRKLWRIMADHVPEDSTLHRKALAVKISLLQEHYDVSSAAGGRSPDGRSELERMSDVLSRVSIAQKPQSEDSEEEEQPDVFEANSMLTARRKKASSRRVNGASGSSGSYRNARKSSVLTTGSVNILAAEEPADDTQAIREADDEIAPSVATRNSRNSTDLESGEGNTEGTESPGRTRSSSSVFAISKHIKKLRPGRRSGSSPKGSGSGGGGGGGGGAGGEIETDEHEGGGKRPSVTFQDPKNMDAGERAKLLKGGNSTHLRYQATASKAKATANTSGSKEGDFVSRLSPTAAANAAREAHRGRTAARRSSSSSGAGSFRRRQVSTLVSYSSDPKMGAERRSSSRSSPAISGSDMIGSDHMLRSTEGRPYKPTRRSIVQDQDDPSRTPLHDSMLDPENPNVPKYPKVAPKHSTPFGESWEGRPTLGHAERSMVAPHGHNMGGFNMSPKSFRRADSSDMGGSLAAFREPTESDADSDADSMKESEDLVPSPAPQVTDTKTQKKYRRASFAHSVEIDLPAWKDEHGETFDPHSQSFHNLSNAFLQNRIVSTRDDILQKNHFWFGDPHLILFFSRFSTLLAAGQLVCIFSQAGPYLFHLEDGIEDAEGDLGDVEGGEDELVYGGPGNRLAMLPLFVRLIILTLLMVGPILVYLRIPVLIRDLVIVWHVGHRADPLVVAEVVRRQKTQIALRSLRLVTLMKMFAEKHMGETPRTTIKSRKDLALAVEDEHGEMPVSKLSPRDKEDLRAMFHAFDADRKGTVSNQNMIAFLMAIFDGNKEVAMKMCAMIDVNDDGHVEEEEFLDWASMIELNHQEDEEEIQAHMFRMIDTDGSGDITISELSDFMMKFGCEMEDQDLMMIMLDVDEDGNGEVDLEEFRIILEKLIPQEEQRRDMADYDAISISDK